MKDTRNSIEQVHVATARAHVPDEIHIAQGVSQRSLGSLLSEDTRAISASS